MEDIGVIPTLTAIQGKFACSNAAYYNQEKQNCKRDD